MSILNRAACVSLLMLAIGQSSITHAQQPAADNSADQIISRMHNGVDKIGKELGGYTDDEKTKLDAWEKKLEDQINADPAKCQGREFQDASFKQLRELLNADHQTKFDTVLAEGRKRLARALTQSNLHQIGLMGMLYSNENNRKMPPDLGALSADQASPKVFLAGDSKTPAPADWETMDAKARAEWVNKNSEYVYLAGGQPGNLDGGFVIAYLKPELAPDGNEFLMGDGSVQTKTADESKAIVADLKDGKNPPPSMK